MEKSIKKNYIYNVSYQIFALLVPLITTPYISRILGASGVGTYSYTYSIVRYFWLLSVLGIATWGTRSIGMYQSDRKNRSYFFWNLISLKIILSIIMVILYMGYVIWIADNKLLALIQGLNLIGVMFDITWFFQGMEEFGKVTIRNFIIKILNVLFIFLFVKSSTDLPIYIFGIAFFLLVGNISMWFTLNKYVDKIDFKSLRPFKDFKIVLQLFIPSIAVQIFSVLDKSMIGWFTNSSVENGYYEQSLKIVDMLLVLITTMGTIMIPRISREYSKGNKEEIKKYLTKSLRFTFIISILMSFGVNAISKVFVPIFFGKEYMKSSILLNILSILFIFMGVNSITGSQYLISTGQQNKHTKFLLIGGSINIILNCILIPRYMSVGAAIATVIGEMMISIFELSYLYKTKQYDCRKLFKYLWKYLFVGIFMFICIKVFSVYINSIIGVLVTAFVGILIYFILLIIIKDDFIINEAIKIKSKFMRR